MDKKEEFIKELVALFNKYDITIHKDSGQMNIECVGSELVSKREYCHPTMSFVEEACLYSNTYSVSIEFRCSDLEQSFIVNTYPYVKDNMLCNNGHDIYRRWLESINKRYGNHGTRI